MLAYLRARALSRGFLGGSQVWMWIGLAVWTIRLFQWLNRPEASVIYRDRLGPGQVVQIIHHEPGPTKRQARRAKRASRRAARR
jgi:hypothetical protein